MKSNLKANMGLLSILLTSCNVGIDNPPKNNLVKFGKYSLTAERLNTTRHGALVYLYKNIADKAPIAMVTNLDEEGVRNIADKDNQKIHLRTYLMVPQTLDYQLLPGISNVKILINGNQITKPVKLSANQLYALDIIITQPFADGASELTWTKFIDNKPINEKIPFTSFLLPTETIFALANRSAQDCKVGDLEDTSCNGIPDDWSDGYTVLIKNGKIVIEKWDEKVHGLLGKTKFRSSPYKWSTAGDPYSDYQKVTSIGLDNSVAPEARNPLIAAYPEISVELDGMVISKNQKLTDTINGSTSQTITTTKSTANLTQHAHKVGLSIGAEWGIPKPKLLGTIFQAFKPTVSYDYTNTTSTTLTTSDSDAIADTEGWAHTIEVNDAQAAYLTPLVHYYNRGTAPAYKVRPKYNLAYKDNNSIISLKTIQAQEAELADVISPNQSYPKTLQDSIVVASNNASLISINKSQLDTIEKNKDIYSSTLETSASFPQSVINGSNLQDWSSYLNRINNSTALIELVTPDGSKLSRRAVATTTDDNNLIEALNPELTLSEAIQLAYKFNISESKLENKDYIYYGFIINIYGQKNLDEINRQLNSNANQALGNVKLKTGMMFTIYPDGWVYDKNTKKRYFYENGRGRYGIKSLIWTAKPGGAKDEDIIDQNIIFLPFDYKNANNWGGINLQPNGCNDKVEILSDGSGLLCGYKISLSDSQILKWNSNQNGLEIIKSGNVTIDLKDKDNGSIVKSLQVDVQSLNTLTWLYKPGGEENLTHISEISVPVDYTGTNGAGAVSFGVEDSANLEVDSSNPGIVELRTNDKHVISLTPKLIGSTILTFKFKNSGLIAKRLTVNITPKALIKRGSITLTNLEIGTYLTDRLDVEYKLNGSLNKRNAILYEAGSRTIPVPAGATNISAKVTRIQYGGSNVYLSLSVGETETRNLCINTTGGKNYYYRDGEC